MAGVNYFEKLPLINYKDNYAKNILVKAKLSNFADTTGAIFYPYTIEEGERADTIAQNYYGDARFDWLVYLSNDIGLDIEPKSPDIQKQDYLTLLNKNMVV